tara:strand:+ start:5456 stop:5773 length:318 start_codon:yes stop_codon:yes gene_type:complete
MEYSNAQIKIALKRYENQNNYKKKYYNNKYHNDDIFKQKILQSSRDYYQSHKDARKTHYENNKDELKAKRKYNYYLKLNNIEKYISKYPDEYETYFKQNSNLIDH